MPSKPSSNQPIEPRKATSTLQSAEAPGAPCVDMPEAVGETADVADPVRGYHHRRLKAAALVAVRDAVEANGHTEVSMRDLAQRLGVVPSALYRHFANREALLLQLADVIHGELFRDLEDLIGGFAEPLDAMAAGGVHFLRFARDHANLFRMMYDDSVVHSTASNPALPALQATYEALFVLGAKAWPKCDGTQVRLRLIAYWSTLFGYATVRDHRLLHSYMLMGVDPQAIESVVVQTALGTAS
jgi:AcrR family transcriptional regulator